MYTKETNVKRSNSKSLNFKPEMLEKGENAGYQHFPFLFSPFSPMFFYFYTKLPPVPPYLNFYNTEPF